MWVPGIELRSPSLDGSAFTTEPPLQPLVTFRRIFLSLFKGPEILRHSQHALSVLWINKDILSIGNGTKSLNIKLYLQKPDYWCVELGLLGSTALVSNLWQAVAWLNVLTVFPNRDRPIAFKVMGSQGGDWPLDLHASWSSLHYPLIQDWSTRSETVPSSLTHTSAFQSSDHSGLYVSLWELD